MKQMKKRIALAILSLHALASPAFSDEIKTLNLELNGTNWIKTHYISKKTGKPVANTSATIYVIFEDEDKSF